METHLMRDEQVKPTLDNLKEVLGESFPVYTELIELMTSTTFNLTTEWNYYKDGKAWLCKVCKKKKTIFWLSIWNGFFKVGFYFTEKTCGGIETLNIAESIKDEFKTNKPNGKFMPLGLRMKKKEHIADAVIIATYKMSLK